jgi:hypothetical protein
MMEPSQPAPAVVAVAGRRIDPTGSMPPRFPLENVPLVRQRLAEVLAAEHTSALVCSAACGTDLIALEEAERLGLRRRIVLPFSPERFRATSVVDRPGNWGPVFDRLVAGARTTVGLPAAAHAFADAAALPITPAQQRASPMSLPCRGTGPSVDPPASYLRAPGTRPRAAGILKPRNGPARTRPFFLHSDRVSGFLFPPRRPFRSAFGRPLFAPAVPPLRSAPSGRGD